MPAPKKTATVAPAKSRWAQLRDEARAKQGEVTPYLFDGTEPPTPIYPPTTVEQVTAMAQIVDSNGDFDVANLRRLFEITCGDAFPAVWPVVKDEPFEVLFMLVGDMNDHFAGVPAGEVAGDLPGGA
ncbi:hypothetical protein [Nocardia farcinica]|uniref:Tail assembly chaperone n=1 Tax=Nocardia farcinica (strain IFM 10152) TaxID=247156 RepID=Q5YSS7_NOCFA|nr:hypothetical protein [Nocardia farcinica]BAD58764.1 hypothetical protein NFA_39160 [Nocardia farcinica IFM 10152]